MNIKDKGIKNAAQMRRRAEELARMNATQPLESLEALSPEQTRQMLHELRVHQTELEIQNEELRRAQVELDATRARYFDLYDLAPVGYCTVGEKGLISEANLTAATLLGVDRRDLVKQPLTRFILKEDQDVYYLYRKQLFETGEPQACELRMAKKDGTQFWAHLAGNAAKHADGTPVCYTVLNDITERKREEQEKADLAARLQRARKPRSAGRKTGRGKSARKTSGK
jgi:PAS domain S-box-containing protein